MHCKSFLISLLPVLLPVIHAATIGQVNAANQMLANEADSFDSNVKQLDTLSAPLKIQGVVNDVESFATNVGQTVTDNQPTEPAEGDPEEETVAQTWSELTANTATYMSDLAEKATILTLQKATVKASLTKLNTNFRKLVTGTDGDESDVDYKDEIDDDGAKALEKIQEAVVAFT